MKTSTTSRPQHTIKGDSKISICVTLITLLHSTLTIYLTITEVKKTFKATENIDLKNPKNRTKDKKREVWSETNFQTLTRSKKSTQIWIRIFFHAKNISTG